jgi:hypothetical protein
VIGRAHPLDGVERGVDRDERQVPVERQHLEIVVERQGLGALAGAPLVAGDEVAVREHLHVTGTEPDADLPSGEACRHRVPALAHADPGLGVDSRRQGHAGHERLGRKRSERRPLGGKGLPGRLGAPGDPAAVVAPVRRH